MSESTNNNVKPGRPSKSGQQVGAENAERLRAYISELRTKGALIPARNGKPDKSAIAIACGFNRQTLYNNPEAVALLEKAAIEIGLDNGTPLADGKALHLQQQMDLRDRRIQRLEQALATRNAENSALRQENKELKEQLRQYKTLEEAISTNGRTYHP
ncbi:MAG TPA: hypothetical protein VK388_04250 [Pyrinomonadaceae bacterium]|nr:hypothetical protein [Pyrinomonadaceae bacterium]